MEIQVLGLCMIVKNEEHVIEKALRSALRMMNTFCIVDTGSTDKTKELIQKVSNELGVVGVIYDRPWVNFGHNRTEALELAKNHMKWAFMLDADDTLEGEVIDIALLKEDVAGYSINIKDNNLEYLRNSLTNLKYNWKYKGVLHEYPYNSFDKPVVRYSNKTFIFSERKGSRSKDDKKYIKDVEVLQKELDTNPDCDKGRTLFYLAQSYKDAGLVEQSKKYYLERAQFNGWKEENYVSYLNLIKFSDGIEEKLKYAWKAQNIVPNRKECVYEVLSYARSNSIFTEEVYALGLVYKDIQLDNNHLFVEPYAYGWSYHDEFGLIAFYRNYFKQSLDSFKTAIHSCSDFQKERILKNIKFCLENIINPNSSKEKDK